MIATDSPIFVYGGLLVFFLTWVVMVVQTIKITVNRADKNAGHYTLAGLFTLIYIMITLCLFKDAFLTEKGLVLVHETKIWFYWVGAIFNVEFIRLKGGRGQN